MREVRLGVIGLGNVGGGTLSILSENAGSLTARLGCTLRVVAVCSRTPDKHVLPPGLDPMLVTANWREVVSHPDVDVIAELVGGTGAAREIVETAIAHGKSVVTANKELMGIAGPELWELARNAGVSLAMEASVCGGIPIHAVLREGIASDRIEALYGILNGTSNYILSEIESHGTSFDVVLQQAQSLGYAETDPTADVEGYDARSKLALLAALAFGERIRPDDITTEGVRCILPEDFQYARQLGYTIRLLCSARRAEHGLLLSVRPALIPLTNLLSNVRGAYNAVLVRGVYGDDTFYYGRGAGSLPTGVAVVSDLMRVARAIQDQATGRMPPFAFTKLKGGRLVPTGQQECPWFLRFRVMDRPGIIASLATILAKHEISVDAILQLPNENKGNLPFVITVEPTRGTAVHAAVGEMRGLPFLVEAPIALPMETSL